MSAPTKIKMSFGSKPATPGSSRQPPPRPPKKPAAVFQDDDDVQPDVPQHEAVSHFDAAAGGAINVDSTTTDKELLVIPVPQNRSWREESKRKRQRSGLPVQQQVAPGVEASAQEDEPIKYGLTVRNRNDETVEGEGDKVANGDAGPQAVEQKEVPKPTDDEVALRALLGDKPVSTLVIPQLTEQEAFQRDYEQAPDEPTLAEYTTIPVEEFGDAMLRGMGWKDGEAFGKNKRGAKPVQPRPVEKRPALLGIGAKHDKAVADELGAWGKGARGAKAAVQAYTPVLLKNKTTGEMLTEDELKAKVEREKLLVADEAEARSASDRDVRRSEKSSRRHRDDGNEGSDYDRKRSGRDTDRDSKYRSSRRERSTSADSYKKRRHDNDYYEKRKDRDQGYRESKDGRDLGRRYKSHRDSEADGDRERKDSDRRRRDRDGNDREHRDKDRKRGERDDGYDSGRRDKERHRRDRGDDYDSERRERVDRHRSDRDGDYDRKRDSRRDR